jgi:hypothetical protein
MATLNFNAATVEPAAGRDPIPAGRYVAMITGSTMKPTRQGNGQFLELEYTLLEGEHHNRKVWSRHNLHNANPQTVEIARRELSAVCRAVGVLQPGDSAELHQKPLTIAVAVRTRPDTGEKVNEVTAWAKREAAAGVPQQAGATGGPATPAWLRKA